MDAPPITCGSIDEFILEGINTVGLFMYGNIRYLANFGYGRLVVKWLSRVLLVLNDACLPVGRNYK